MVVHVVAPDLQEVAPVEACVLMEDQLKRCPGADTVWRSFSPGPVHVAFSAPSRGK